MSVHNVFHFYQQLAISFFLFKFVVEPVRVENSQSASCVQLGAVVKQTNPWASTATQQSDTNRPSDAENWLNSTASRIDPFARAPAGSVGAARLRPVNGFGTGYPAPAPSGPFQVPAAVSLSSAVQHYPAGSYPAATVSAVGSTPFAASVNPQFQPPPVVPSWAAAAPPSTNASASATPSSTAPIDPFDSAWAARASSARAANPFQPG